MGSLKMVFGFSQLLPWCSDRRIGAAFLLNYQFEDAIKTEAQMGTYSTKGDDTIRDAVFKKAQELNVPVVREQIKITRVGSAYNGSVTIEAPYTVHLSLPGYPLDLNFDPSSTNRSVF